MLLEALVEMGVLLGALVEMWVLVDFGGHSGVAMVFLGERSVC